MNRRGDMPTMLIFIMALVLSAATLFSFASFKDDLQSQSAEFSELQRAIDFNYQYILKSAELIGGRAIKEGSADFKQSFTSVAKERDIRLYGSGNFFTKVSMGDFMFDKQTGEYVLNVKDLVVFTDLNGNKIRRSFNLEMTFDSSGKMTDKKISFNV